MPPGRPCVNTQIKGVKGAESLPSDPTPCARRRSAAESMLRFLRVLSAAASRPGTAGVRVVVSIVRGRGCAAVGRLRRIVARAASARSRGPARPVIRWIARRRVGCRAAVVFQLLGALGVAFCTILGSSGPVRGIVLVGASPASLRRATDGQKPRDRYHYNQFLHHY